MDTALHSTTTTLFLGGLIAGFVVMTAIRVMRGLAKLLVTVVVLAAIAAVAIEGPAGLMRWLQLALVELAEVGPFFSGTAAGQLLAGIFVSALDDQPRRRR